MSLFDLFPGPLNTKLPNTNLPNIKLPTMGGKVFWDELASKGGYRLQKNKLTGDCRILDDDDWCVANGDEGEMRAKLRKLTTADDRVSPRYGDVVGVRRMGGLYDHYGVYEDDDSVYEYAAEDGDFGGAMIRVSTFAKFLGDSRDCFVLEFPERHTRPGKVDVGLRLGAGVAGSGLVGLDILSELWNRLFSGSDYHIYSPEETIQRARSRLGEAKYNLVTNNCEHFAIWCKTGVSESHQVNDVLKAIFDQRISPTGRR